MKWYTPEDYRLYFRGKDSLDYYESNWSERSLKYPYTIKTKYVNTVSELEEKGYCILKQAIDKRRLLKLKEETERALKDDELLKKNDINMKMVANPLLNLPSAVSIAFDNVLIDVATAYFKCLPGVGTLNMRESYVNSQPPVETMLFHSDKNSCKFLKFFFYLNDVDLEGGPFTYVEGSHKLKFEDWLSKYRWSDEEIEAKYGQERIKYLTASMGDIIVANTTGFHKGLKPQKRKRLMYTVNYGVHVELGTQNYKEDKRFYLRESDYQNLPDEKKTVADFLRIIPDSLVASENQEFKKYSQKLNWQ